MDRVAATYWLGRVAHLLNRLGLKGVTSRARVLFEGRQLEAEMLGFRLRASVRHRAYLAEMRAGRRERFMVELFEQSAREGDLVVDVGACLGLFTLVAARRVGLNGHVLAFEANPETYPLLLQNIELNGFADRVQAMNRAVSDRGGSAAFFLNDAAASSSSMFPPDTRSRQTIVERCAIDEFVSTPDRLGLVKIDAEGAEVEVLRGMRETLRRAPPHLRLFAECNPALLERAGASTGALLAELDAAGLSAQLIDERDGVLRPFTGDLAGEAYANLLCQPSGGA